MADHPRLCGANWETVWNAIVAFGSSPLVRGKHAAGDARTAFERIIPACAGQTLLRFWCGDHYADHPRLCGANWLSNGIQWVTDGSSPLVRGKHVRMVGNNARFRIIPACAGQTALGKSTESKASDHPRLCGANLNWPMTLPEASGSSPLVRGKPDRHTLFAVELRIIPACAGQTNAMTTA